LTEPDLEHWGREIGRAALAGGVFVCLYGELGAGKSTLARAACRGAGVTGPVPSPTFTLLNQYEGDGGVTVQHADLYRIHGPEGLSDMGWADLVQSHDLVLLEWADRADGYLPAERWEIRLEFSEDPARRRVRAVACGSVIPVPQPLRGAEDDSW
jgi:tRNA threonylcarbamoyladenosine biosynthesis protein TsaE